MYCFFYVSFFMLAEVFFDISLWCCVLLILFEGSMFWLAHVFLRLLKLAWFLLKLWWIGLLDFFHAWWFLRSWGCIWLMWRADEFCLKSLEFLMLMVGMTWLADGFGFKSSKFPVLLLKWLAFIGCLNYSNLTLQLAGCIGWFEFFLSLWSCSWWWKKNLSSCCGLVLWSVDFFQVPVVAGYCGLLKWLLKFLSLCLGGFHSSKFPVWWLAGCFFLSFNCCSWMFKFQVEWCEDVSWRKSSKFQIWFYVVWPADFFLSSMLGGMFSFVGGRYFLSSKCVWCCTYPTNISFSTELVRRVEWQDGSFSKHLFFWLGSKGVKFFQVFVWKGRTKIF